jgi:hypothetical protein
MTRSVSRVLAVPAVLVLLAGAGQPPDKKDRQSAFEPKSKPGAGQTFLEKFVGEWDVAKSFHPKTGEPFRQKGECKQAMTHGGRFLQSDFIFATADGKSTGTGLIGWEPETGQFTSVWIDARQTRMSLRQGEDQFDGEQIVLFGKELGGREGRRSNTVTKLEDGGKKIVHRQYAVSADGTERLVMELVLTRKPAVSPGK